MTDDRSSRSTAPPAFLEAAAALGVSFEPDDLPRLDRFLDLLEEANARFNLTRVTGRDEAWTRHILDSLTLVPLLVTAGARTVADVGSGGGPPGLPLAAVMPDVAFTLIEATGKKARFLEETAAALGLDNVTVVAERAEVVGHDRERYRERHDAAIARAVGTLPVLLELTVPLVRAGGLVLAIKGERASEEIEAARAALHLLHATVIDCRRTSTGTIVIVEKRRLTPKVYPRRPGEPKRVPLGGASRAARPAP